MEALRWKWLWGGILVGGCAIMAAMGMALYHDAKYSGSAEVCVINIGYLSKAVDLYSTDHDERLPLADSWRTATKAYAKTDAERYPSADSEVGCPMASSLHSYAMNRALAGVPASSIKEPATTVLLFDADASKFDASGGEHEMVYRHEQRCAVALVNGKTRLVSKQVKLRWQP